LHSFIALLILLVQNISAQNPIKIMDENLELSITAISDYSIRMTFLPMDISGNVIPLKQDLVLGKQKWAGPEFKAKTLNDEAKTFRIGVFTGRISNNPVLVSLYDSSGKEFQRITITEEGVVKFLKSNKPIYGLGSGGQKLNKNGSYESMDKGHRAHEYQIWGSKIPVPFLIDTEGSSIFFHRPYSGSFDLRNEEGLYIPRENSKMDKESTLPIDLFITRLDYPGRAISEYNLITGRAPLPPKWAFGYMQSHRTLARGPEEVMETARIFRSKKLPCDALIYLGTGYCPIGWNKGHGTVEFNPEAFDKPQEMIDRLHEDNFKIVLHVNRAPNSLHGEMKPPETDKGMDYAYNYWQMHKEVLSTGIEGWWPDDGDGLPVDGRLTRHMIYYEGSLLEQPDIRPFSLHRTGYAGMQKFGGWIWSGDVFSLWATLKAHVAVGINASLSASPYWGTDIGGFTPTSEYSGELYARWFQFAAFTPLFRSHGRLWYLHRPWGWSTGDMGPNEVVPTHTGSTAPDSSKLLNEKIEPICKKYLELRYRLIPYVYSAARENYDTGLPIMRALWLHYPDDPYAVKCEDEYLWGENILVAPITREGAVNRDVYLPEGLWYGFWSKRRYYGKTYVNVYADLSTIPLFVKAGSIIPLDPVRQYVDEPSDKPVTIKIYTGADGVFKMYEDDGISNDYKNSEFFRTVFQWYDNDKILIIEPYANNETEHGISKSLLIEVISDSTIEKNVEYKGERLAVNFKE